MFKIIREIRDRLGNLVFRRWLLLRTPWFSVFLHGMYDERGDRDAHCHDHPWDFWSLVLWGGYFEVQHDTNQHRYRVRRPGSLSYMPAADRYHRILQLRKKKSFSLVFARPANRMWGYWTQDGWIDNVEYRRRKLEGTLPAHRHSDTYLERIRERWLRLVK